MASPFPFTSGQVLTAAQLNSIGDYTDYSGSISFTNFTLGNGTAEVFYTQVNDLVHFVGKIVLGSTSVVINTTPLFSLPVAPAAVNDLYMTGTTTFRDDGTATYAGVCSVNDTADALVFRALANAGTYSSWVSMGPTVPFIWTTNDELYWNVTYKAA